MTFYLPRKGAGVADMCSCNKNKNGQTATFVVTTASGEPREVKSEAEARALVRISGGTYKKK